MRVGLGALDFPAMASALWSLYDQTGIRPEWVLPVLWDESGFNPSIVNSIGCVGINQACPNAMPIPAGYASWSASQQMAGLVTPMYRSIVARYGPLQSGTRAWQANILPGTLGTKKDLSDVLAAQGSSAEVCPHCGLTQGAVYAANAGLDYQRTGAIRISDIAHFIGKAAANSTVRSAIAQTYAQRPGETPTDPVYGLDYGSGSSNTPRNIALVLAGLGLGAAAIYALRQMRIRRYLQARAA